MLTTFIFHIDSFCFRCASEIWSRNRSRTRQTHSRYITSFLVTSVRPVSYGSRFFPVDLWSARNKRNGARNGIWLVVRVQTLINLPLHSRYITSFLVTSVRTVSYGSRFFPVDLWSARNKPVKTRVKNIQLIRNAHASQASTRFGFAYNWLKTPVSQSFLLS